MKDKNPVYDFGSCLPPAYSNGKFLRSRDGRALRILSEYLQPLSHFREEKVHDTVVFFGSARIAEDGPMGQYYRDARGLARKVTEWSDKLENPVRRFVITTGGGPGIMEAANRGAHDAGGKSIGLNIGLPFEQEPNEYISTDLCFEFHYFFMRKFWLAYLAKGMVVFPGGFGTLDEFSEILTLAQTRKLDKEVVIVLYGSSFWKEVLNLEALAKYGMISPEDLNLFHYADDVDGAFEVLRDGLTRLYLRPDEPVPVPAGADETPAIAHSRT